MIMVMIMVMMMMMMMMMVVIDDDNGNRGVDDHFDIIMYNLSYHQVQYLDW